MTEVAITEKIGNMTDATFNEQIMLRINYELKQEFEEKAAAHYLEKLSRDLESQRRS